MGWPRDTSLFPEGPQGWIGDSDMNTGPGDEPEQEDEPMGPNAQIIITRDEIIALRQLVLVCESVASVMKDEALKRRQTELTNVLAAVLGRAEFAAEHS